MKRVLMAVLTIGMVLLGLAGIVDAAIELPSLTPGWNLVGLMHTAEQTAIDVTELGNVTSVWKWTTINGTKTWAVYLPGEGTPGAYAEAKGFGKFTTIDPGEGFWVNAPDSGGNPTSGLGLGALLPSLNPGWNLVGLIPLAGLTPSAVTELGNITSAWKWTTVNNVKNWAVYLGGEADKGAAYAAAKGYGQFTAIEPGEGFWVNVPDSGGNPASGSAPWALLKLPDTGQTTQYSTVFGDDANYTINPPLYIDNGDSTIADVVTGLTWQKEVDATKRTWSAAGTYCADLAHGGQSDWRLPNEIELMSIADYGKGDGLNPVYFPGASSSWTSTASADSATGVWYASGGTLYVSPNMLTQYVRCVRGGQTDPGTGSAFSDNGDGTITDNRTGLVWQKQDDGAAKLWEDALTYCEGLAAGGSSNWRLPNVKELRTIVDYTLFEPAVQSQFFPDTKSAEYWSSTNAALFAWYVDFQRGKVFSQVKTKAFYTRCVRSDQLTLMPALDIATAKTAQLDKNGGTLSLAYNGASYLLTVPPNALAEATEIKMTPLTGFAGAQGTPMDTGIQAGVQLEPAGLILCQPATLTITLPTALSPDQIFTFGYRGKGDNIHLYPATIQGNDLQFLLNHFSGYGQANGGSGAVAKQLTYIPTPWEEKSLQDIAVITQKHIANTDLNFSKDEISTINGTMDEWWNESIWTGLCGVAVKNPEFVDIAEREFISWHRSAAQLDDLGVEWQGQDKENNDKRIDDGYTCLAKALKLALDEAAKKCKGEDTVKEVLRRAQEMYFLGGLGERVGIANEAEYALEKLKNSCGYIYSYQCGCFENVLQRTYAPGHSLGW